MGGGVFLVREVPLYVSGVADSVALTSRTDNGFQSASLSTGWKHGRPIPPRCHVMVVQLLRRKMMWSYRTRLRYPAFLSVCLSFHLSIYLSISLSVYLSVYLSIYQSINLSIYIYLFIYLSKIGVYHSFQIRSAAVRFLGSP